MKIISSIEDEEMIKKILKHLGFPLSHYKSFLSGSPPEGLRKYPLSRGFFS